MNKYLEYEISKDFNNSDKAIYSRCFKFIHQEIYNNPRIDIDFLKKIIIINKKIISCSFYYIHGGYEATWSASFGYDREEQYTVFEEVKYTDQNNNVYYKKEPLTKNKTVTDWRPLNGSDVGDFKTKIYAGNFFAKNPPGFLDDLELPEKGNKFNKKKYDIIDEYKFSKSQILKQANTNGKEDLHPMVDRSIVRTVVDSNKKGDRDKDWNIYISTNNIMVATVNYPVAVIDLEFNKKKYKLIYAIDSKDSHFELSGKFPVDKKYIETEKIYSSKWKGFKLLFWYFIGPYMLVLTIFGDKNTLANITLTGFWLIFIYAVLTYFRYSGVLDENFKKYQSILDQILSERISKL